MIATDAKRGWFWFLESVGKRVHKLDREGKELLVIKDIEASSLAVDPESGNVWVVVTHGLIYGDHTEVYDADGKLVGKHEVRGWDIAYDPKGKSFWLAGKDLTKIEAQTGQVLLAKPVTAWCASSIAVHAATGTVWMTARRHPDVAKSANELLSFDNEGNLKNSVDLGESDENHLILPFRVSVNQQDGSVWVTLLRTGVRHYSSAGELKCERALWAMAAEAAPGSDDSWVVVPQGLVRLNSDGKIVDRFDHKFEKSQAWMATF